MRKSQVNHPFSNISIYAYRCCLLLAFMLVLFTSQSSDKQEILNEQVAPVSGKNIILSELEKDPASEKLVLNTIKLSNQVYTGYGEWGSFKKRYQSQIRLKKLIGGGIFKDEFPELVKELNISQNSFYETFVTILNSEATLIEKYGEVNLASIAFKNVEYHVKQADKKLKASARNQQPVCNNCPFNNCSECSSGDPTYLL